MAVYYYISSAHGTKTSGVSTFTSLQTGAMTSLPTLDVYDSLANVEDFGSVSPQDFILIADNHSEPSFNGGTIFSQGTLHIISVDNTAIDTYAEGAIISVGGGGSRLNGAAGGSFCSGLVSSGSTATALRPTTNGVSFWQNCDFGFTGTELIVSPGISSYEQCTTYIDSECALTGAGTFCVPAMQSVWLFTGINISGSSATTLCNIGAYGINVVAAQGLLFEGCDLSGMASGFNAFGTVGAGASDGQHYGRLVHCKTPASWTLLEETPVQSPGVEVRYEAVGCDDTDPSTYWREDGKGTIISVNTPYIAGQTKMDAATPKQYTYQVTTRADLLYEPLVVPMAVQYDDLSTLTTGTLQIATSGSLTLNDADIQLYVEYSLSTDDTKTAVVQSGTAVSGSYISDPLASGSALASGSGNWTGTVANEYVLTVEVSSALAAPSVLHRVWVCIWCDTDKDNAGDVIYLDSEVVFS